MITKEEVEKYSTHFIDELIRRDGGYGRNFSTDHLTEFDHHAIRSALVVVLNSAINDKVQSIAERLKSITVHEEERTDMVGNYDDRTINPSDIEDVIGELTGEPFYYD